MSDERNVVRAYMGSGFKRMNGVLRGVMQSRSGQQDIDLMLVQLQLYARVASGKLIYRHVGARAILKGNNKEYGKKRGDSFRTGGEFRDRAFMSASQREEYITDALAKMSDRQHVLIITTCANSRAHDVKALTENESEAEVIFEPSTKFHITSKSNRKFGKKTARVWYMTELAEGRNQGLGDEIKADDFD